MSKLIPDVQIGTLGGTLIWVALVTLIIIALFTVGLTGPLLVAGAVLLVLVVVAYFGLSRLSFRLKRGK